MGFKFQPLGKISNFDIWVWPQFFGQFQHWMNHEWELIYLYGGGSEQKSPVGRVWTEVPNRGEGLSPDKYMKHLHLAWKMQWKQSDSLKNT